MSTKIKKKTIFAPIFINNVNMNAKVKSALQDKCKDFGLTDKAIEELATMASEGITEESSDEDIEKVVTQYSKIAKAMQGEITRKSQKKTQTPKQPKKGGEGDEEDDDDEEDEKLPKWFKKFKKENDETISALKTENEQLKAEKAKAERQSHISELAKKAGLSEKKMEAIIKLQEVYGEGDDEAVNTALANLKQIDVNEKLPNADETSILSSSEQAMKDDAEAWAKSQPDAK